MHLDVSGPGQPAKHVVGMGWSCPKDIRFEDCVEFSDAETDFFGMPKMRIRYELTPIDRSRIGKAAREQERACAALGKRIFDDEALVVVAATP